MPSTKIEILEDGLYAPFGFKALKCKKGDIITADSDNAKAWIEQKKARASKGKSKNKEPKNDNSKKPPKED